MPAQGWAAAAASSLPLPPPSLPADLLSPLPALAKYQDDREVSACYFDAAVRNRTAKINDFFLKYLTGGCTGRMKYLI